MAISFSHNGSNGTRMLGVIRWLFAIGVDLGLGDHEAVARRGMSDAGMLAGSRRSTPITRDRWVQATEKFRQALAALYPREWSETVAGFQRGEPAAVDPAITFLEADPRCRRSGYEKERLCRFLGRSELSAL